MTEAALAPAQIDRTIIVEDRHFAYLAEQKGALDELRGNREEWERAYAESLRQDLLDVQPHLPVGSVLDIGSGLGGIDVLIDRASGGGVRVCLLDGVDDPPRMRLHRETFNDMQVAMDFLRINGVLDSTWTPPSRPRAQTFDLIISFGSWCFHYPPETYLEFVKLCCIPGETAIILDVRRSKAAWAMQLSSAFKKIEVIRSGRKYDRILYRAR